MDKVALILSSISLPDLCRKLGLPSDIPIGRAILSPLRRESRPSFAAYVSSNGHWIYKDYGSGDQGDVIKFYAKATGSTKPITDLYALWFENGHITPVAMEKPRDEPLLPAVPLNWNERVSKLTDDMLVRLSEWRGYPLEFCNWLREKRIIGSYADTFCFPVYNFGHVVRFHVRWPTGAWQYLPKGVASHLTPLVIGPGNPYLTFGAESQWDLFAVMSALPMEFVRECKWIATRGVSNGGGPADYILRQRDDTPAKVETEAKWADRWEGARSIWPPRANKDLNEWMLADRIRFEKMLAKWIL